MSGSAKNVALREAVITALLVIAGVLLAICMFAAGLFWRGKPAMKGTAPGDVSVQSLGFEVGIEPRFCKFVEARLFGERGRMGETSWRSPARALAQFNCKTTDWVNRP